MDAASVQRDFENRLRRAVRTWHAGRILAAALDALTWAAWALLAAFVLDFFLAWPVGVCVAAGLLVPGIGGVRLATALVRILAQGPRAAALRLDRLTGSRRLPILTACELSSGPGAATPDGLTAFLSAQSIAQADAALAQVRFRDRFPCAEVAAGLRRFLLHGGLVLAVLLLNPMATRTILARLFVPFRDTPPYSRYTFSVRPAWPTVTYGGTLEMAVTIQPAPSGAVSLATRYAGSMHRAACFRESERRYAQRLERVVVPLEFCFMVGRARSPWYPVRLRLQPEVTGAMVTLTPPPYTGLPVRRFEAGREPLAGYRHSRVRLTVTSNRPLQDGSLRVRPRRNPADERNVAGRRVSPHAVQFDWSLDAAALLDVTVRDVQGTANAEAFEIDQALTEDRPPEVAITEPAGFALATPSVKLDVAGRASDDLGVRQIDLARSLVGYRDRIQRMGPGAQSPREDFGLTLDLARIGVRAGDVLEFYAEARDSNPALTGITASEIVRVQVISEEEYAAMLRARTTLEEFMGRYEVAARTMEQLVEQLGKLAEAARAGDPAAAEAALQESRAAYAEALGVLNKLAEDFPIFDTERQLGETLRQVTGVLTDQASRLGAMRAGDAGLAEQVESLQKELRPGAEAVEQQKTTAEEIAAITRVMEWAVRFKTLVARQTELVRRLQRFERETPRDIALLEALGRTQDEIRTELQALLDGLPADAQALPESQAQLKNEAEQFLRMLSGADVTGSMGQAVTASTNHDGPRTYRFAQEALEKLQQVQGNCSGGGFGGLCQGNMGLGVSELLSSTLQQMLAALLQRLGSGNDTGSGVGPAGGYIGGDTQSGSWSGGHSPLNVPVYGPNRQTVRTPGLAGSGRSSATVVGERRVVQTDDASNTGRTHRVESRNYSWEQVPSQYRQAVKRFFTEEERHATPGR